FRCFDCCRVRSHSTGGAPGARHARSTDSETVPNVRRKLTPAREPHSLVNLNRCAVRGGYRQARPGAAIAAERFERSPQQLITDAAMAGRLRNAHLCDVTDVVRHQAA